MKAIKSKKWYDAQLKARENAIINLTKLVVRSQQIDDAGLADIPLKNKVFNLQNEFNELRAERDLYYA